MCSFFSVQQILRILRTTKVYLAELKPILRVLHKKKEKTKKSQTRKPGTRSANQKNHKQKILAPSGGNQKQNKYFDYLETHKTTKILRSLETTQFLILRTLVVFRLNPGGTLRNHRLFAFFLKPTLFTPSLWLWLFFVTLQLDF